MFKNEVNISHRLHIIMSVVVTVLTEKHLVAEMTCCVSTEKLGVI